jgi:hypothetical protein
MAGAKPPELRPQRFQLADAGLQTRNKATGDGPQPWRDAFICSRHKQCAGHTRT